jgi:amino acid adenylation domain-containing protein
MSDRPLRIADLSPEKRELLLRRLNQKEKDVARPQIRSQPRESNMFPLSFAQQRLWLLDRFEPGSATYNIPVALRLTGALNIVALAQSINAIIQRHEALRTTFIAVEGRPAQVIAARLRICMPVADLRTLDAPAHADATHRLIDKEAQRPFDLAHGPLLRTTLLRLADETHILLLTMHHIVADGWSLAVFLRELAALYAACASGQQPPLPELPIQYVDFAIWQHEWLQGEVLERQLAYWKARLGDQLAVLELPTDQLRPPVRTFRGARRSLVLPGALSAALTALSRHEEATLFMTLLTAFKLLLQRYTAQDDIVVGSPIAGRTRSEIEAVLGCFLNTLVLRTDLAGNPSFRELLGRVREVCLGAYAHQDLPFEKLLEELRPERDLSHTPLFQVMFNMLNFPDTQIAWPGLTCEILGMPDIGAKFDLTLYVEANAEGIRLDLIYNADLFGPARMEALLEQFHALLTQIVERPDARIDDLSLVTPAARAHLPNPTETLALGWGGALHTAVAQHAQRAPRQLAVRDPQEIWTYRELDTWSNQLANYLIAQGIQPQDVVAIYAHRSAALVLALLGVLKAGAAFMILDPAYPAARLIDYLGLAQPRGWIALEAAGAPPAALAEFLAALACRCQLQLPRHILDAAPQPFGDCSPDAPAIAVGPDDLAYVAFTSGSTGRPKGILGDHRPLAHFLDWHCRTFGLSQDDRFSMLSGLAHDPLLRDIFTPLWLGATICIPDPEAIGSPDFLAAWMQQRAITVAHLTPVLGHLLSEAAPDLPRAADGTAQLLALRYVFFGGDILTRRQVARLRRLVPAATCVNYYGATETPQGMAYFIVPHEAEPAHDDAGAAGSAPMIVPLGRGIADVQLLVLNKAQRLAGISEIGEICIRTPYLTRGYLADDSLTQERFILNPFTQADGDHLYRTADLGRYLPDGTVAFQGRTDHQVKIRGFRIELGEVEALLGQHPNVRAVAVVAREDVPGDKRLVAYVVPTNDERRITNDEERDPSAVLRPSSLVSDLRDFLKARLPDYMLPAAFVTLEALPLTPNGKVDRKALPKPDSQRPEAEASYTAPHTEIERMIAAAWQAVLHLELVGVDDNFFDLGGSSLHTVQIQSRLRETLHAEIAIIDLFKYPTVRTLARFVSREEREQPLFQDIQDRIQKQKMAMERQKRLRSWL